MPFKTHTFEFYQFVCAFIAIYKLLRVKSQQLQIERSSRLFQSPFIVKTRKRKDKSDIQESFTEDANKGTSTAKEKKSPPKYLLCYGFPSHYEAQNPHNLTRQKQWVHTRVGMKRRGKTGDNKDFINQCRSQPSFIKPLLKTLRIPPLRCP